ncbi:GntR family transcriptional regulator [Lentzea sp. JNUCC 0626]|uniref:GntR family transcriptional regulator n=1 Tax=Lentzea sp. JNUCC 0626 TaxID=3367513 RepID=UPI003747EA0C
MSWKYRRIADDLIEAIDRGEHPVGSTLPSLNDLMTHYGVARQTARAAIGALVDQGVAVRRQGFGTIVRESKSPGETNSPRPGQGPVPLQVYCEWEPAPPETARRLSVSAQSTVLHRIHHLRGAIGTVVRIDHQWLPRGVTKALHQVGRDPATDHRLDLVDLLRGAGVDPVVAMVHVGLGRASRTDTDVLRMNASALVLTCRYTLHSSSGRPIAATTTLLAAEAGGLSFSVPASVLTGIVGPRQQSGRPLSGKDMPE